MNRAYSLFTIKKFDSESRIIEGIASTPAPDRMGDVVEPQGAKYKLPIPLLWQHRQDQPVGKVVYVNATSKQIEFRAELAQIDEPGSLKDLLDFAWQSVKADLVRGVSIGFNPIKRVLLDGGSHFQKWDWLELSLVTIPANAEASIQSIKSMDKRYLAASGRKDGAVLDTFPPGVTGLTKAAFRGPVKLIKRN